MNDAMEPSGNRPELMIHSGTIGNIARHVECICARFPEIAAAYLFGSVLRPDFGRHSDVDVAVLLFPEHTDSVTVTLPLMVALEKALGRPVDVALLNRAGELLKYEVRRTGRLVLDRSPAFRKRFEILGRKHFEDFIYLHRRYTRKNIYGGDGGQPASDRTGPC